MAIPQQLWLLTGLDGALVGVELGMELVVGFQLGLSLAIKLGMVLKVADKLGPADGIQLGTELCAVTV